MHEGRTRIHRRWTGYTLIHADEPYLSVSALIERQRAAVLGGFWAFREVFFETFHSSQWQVREKSPSSKEKTRRHEGHEAVELSKRIIYRKWIKSVFANEVAPSRYEHYDVCLFSSFEPNKIHRRGQRGKVQVFVKQATIRIVAYIFFKYSP